MNFIDVIFLIILISAAIQGAVKGFVIEIASLAAFILGVWGAIRFSGALETFLVKGLGISFVHIRVFAFIAIMIVISIGIHFLAKYIQKLIEATPLSTANRILGIFLGLFKAAFFLGVLVILSEQLKKEFSFIPEEKIKESKLYKPLHNIALTGFPFLQGLIHDFSKEKNEEEEPPVSTFNATPNRNILSGRSEIINEKYLLS